MENENDQAEVLNQQEEEVLQTSQDNEQQEGESVEEYKARLAKAEELANNYRIRAEKAERMAKQPREAMPTPSSELSGKELYALIDAKVPQEDVDEVLEYAKLKKISIGEALKTSVVKAILSDKAEQRRTAEATNVTGSKRVSAKASDDALMENAKKGNLPDSDEDIMRLIRARQRK